MKSQTKLILFLLIIPVLIGELLCGSSPPLKLINPVGFLMMFLIYGCGTILIREAKVRWNLQWSVILLPVAYGIVEEGILVKSFFNPAWGGLGALSNYGVLFGFQMVWVISLGMYHATMSTLIPIALSELLWPEFSKKPILKKRGIVWSIIGISFITLFGMFFFGTEVAGKMVPYYPNPLALIFCFLIVGLLIFLAYKFKDSKKISNTKLISPKKFFIAGFLFMLFVFLVPNLFASAKVPSVITILIQMITIALTLLFVFRQIYNENLKEYSLFCLIFGSLFFWILITPINEFVLHSFGMFSVGIVAFILLLIMRKYVIKRFGK